MIRSTSTWKRVASFSTVAAALLLAAPSAQAVVIIFDDADGPGWSRSWTTPSQATHVYEGTMALRSAQGQFGMSNTGGFVGSEHILEFYANTTDETPAHQLYVTLSWTDADGTSHTVPFSSRNIPATYIIDDVSVEATTGGFSLDTDLDTWQKVQLDLTQTAYTGWPYIAHTYVPGADTIASIGLGTNPSGQSANVVIDNVRLIPEPALLSLLGLGMGALLRRRRW